MTKTKAPNKIDKKAIETYLLPELENIKALLEGLKLPASLAAFLLLQHVVNYELKRFHK